MTLRNFFKYRAIVFVIILIIGFSIYGYKAYFSSSQDPEVVLPTNIINTPPAFRWSYEKDDSLNLDGNPQTNVFLEATYSSGEAERKLVDTTPGGCNDLPDLAEGSLAGTTNAQCYSAGLGYRYKITKGENSYQVERKTFEEASPDYQPPVYAYEVVTQFPLIK